MQCRSYATAVATALVLLLTVGLFLNNAPYNLVIDLPTLPFGAKPITHVVLLEFKPSIGAGEIGKVLEEMTALREKCVHPISEGPYIRGIRGGKNLAPSGTDSGVTHVFIIEFESIEHRDYYLDFDPAHKAFRETIGPLLEHQITSVDFSDGRFFRRSGQA